MEPLIKYPHFADISSISKHLVELKLRFKCTQSLLGFWQWFYRFSDPIWEWRPSSTLIQLALNWCRMYENFWNRQAQSAWNWSSCVSQFKSIMCKDQEYFMQEFAKFSLSYLSFLMAISIWIMLTSQIQEDRPIPSLVWHHPRHEAPNPTRESTFT